ncbi:MAG: hypothetical protein ACFBSE_12155 [Prochloraceae cyanobacterium]
MTQFKIRFAKKTDKETVLNICQNTWQDSEDYIPLVWDEWIEDSRGKIFVVTTTAEDIPIALRRVFLISENESWWEGFRVAPNYRKYFLSIISLVEKSINQYLLENNISRSRSCVWSNSKAMQTYTWKRKKRDRIGKYTLYEAEIIKESSNKIIKLNLDYFDRVYSLITKYNSYPESKKNKIIYASISDKCQELTEQEIRDRLKLGKIWGLKEKETITDIAIESPTTIDKQQFWIGYISGETETLSTLLLEIIKLAYSQKKSNVGLFVSCQENVLKSLDRAGYKRSTPHDIFVYQWENNKP